MPDLTSTTGFTEAASKSAAPQKLVLINNNHTYVTFVVNLLFFTVAHSEPLEFTLYYTG